MCVCILDVSDNAIQYTILLVGYFPTKTMVPIRNSDKKCIILSNVTNITRLYLPIIIICVQNTLSNNDTWQLLLISLFFATLADLEQG